MIAAFLSSRLFAEILAGVILVLVLAVAWVLHDHHERAIGAQACRQAVATATAAAVASQKAQGDAEVARVNKVLEDYKDATSTLNPVAISIGSRVRKYTLTCGNPVPAAAADPGGAGHPAEEPAGADAVGSSIAAVATACASDAAQLSALQAAWPR